MLVEANESATLGEMVRGIAHDFKNLVHALKNNLHLIERTEDDQTAAEHLENAHDMVDRAADFAENLMSFGGAGEQETQEVDLNERLENIEEFLDYALPATIEIKVDLADDVPNILAIPVQFDQIVMNLVVNARDAVKEAEESGTITIETSRKSVGQEELEELEPGEYAYVEVSDTGPGIDPESREQLFEPFSSTKSSEGHGLGLATVYGIVSNGRGFVDVESTPGEGTMFGVYLPHKEEL